MTPPLLTPANIRERSKPPHGRSLLVRQHTRTINTNQCPFIFTSTGITKNHHSNRPESVDFSLTASVAQKGGNPMKIINSMETKVNQYLISHDGSYVLQIDPNRNHSCGVVSNCLGFGGRTAVFVVNVIRDQHGRLPKNVELILRVIEMDSYPVDMYVQKWNIDRQILIDQIPSMYLYGRIYNSGTSWSIYTRQEI